ncbi:hypothetical protein DUI87_09222 [Hirundo rustica rustica]|uniref:Uncharacterized protein n=1 Tax=Hirundo rustica rustica TaxID=333673 RepID=A0A3M0KM68_HIRRU|nr:hypothetical protein DUI87_09222 [Hirundo rustica rustica]
MSGTAPMQGQHIAPGFAEPHEVPMGPLPKHVQVTLNGIPFFYCVTCTAQLCVIVKFTEGTWISLSVSLVKALKSINPKTEPSGTPLVTSLHLDIEPFTTTLCQSSQFLTYHIVHVSNPCLSNLDRRMSSSSSTMKNIYEFLVSS